MPEKWGFFLPLQLQYEIERVAKPAASHFEMRQLCLGWVMVTLHLAKEERISYP
jgi:hypothetical protein